MNNSEILGEEAAVRQIVEDDFSATNGVFEDDSITALRASSLRGKTNLKILSLPNCTNLGLDAINGNASLESVSLEKVKTIDSNNFHSANILKELVLPSVEGALGGNFARESYSIIHVDLGVGATKLNNDSLSSKICDELILRNPNQVVEITGSAYYANLVGHVYVPSALVSSYQTATNWAALYAKQPDLFRALENYTVDGTITGELNQTLANPEVQPVYTLSDQYFDGSTYIDTGVKLYDTDGKFTILMKVTIPSGYPSSGRYACCFSQSLGGGFYFHKNANSSDSMYVHFHPTGSTNGYLIDAYSSGEYLLYVRSVGLNLAMGTLNLDRSHHNVRNITRTGTLINHSNNLILGAHYDDSTNTYSYYLKGTMHKVKVYKEALTGHQILKELDSF